MGHMAFIDLFLGHRYVQQMAGPLCALCKLTLYEQPYQQPVDHTASIPNPSEGSQKLEAEESGHV